MKTKVVFRQFKGEVIALFPREPAECSNWHTCLSYVHVGQHSAADPWLVVSDSRPATPKQYAPLARELRRIGYQLTIGKRIARADTEARRAAWNK